MGDFKDTDHAARKRKASPSPGPGRAQAEVVPTALDRFREALLAHVQKKLAKPPPPQDVLDQMSAEERAAVDMRSQEEKDNWLRSYREQLEPMDVKQLALESLKFRFPCHQHVILVPNWHTLRDAIFEWVLNKNKQLPKDAQIAMPLKRSVSSKKDLIELCLRPDVHFDFSNYVKDMDSNSHHKAARRAKAKEEAAKKASSSAFPGNLNIGVGAGDEFPSFDGPAPMVSSPLASGYIGGFGSMGSGTSSGDGLPELDISLPPIEGADDNNNSNNSEHIRALVPAGSHSGAASAAGGSRSPKRYPPLKRHRMRSPSPISLPASFDFPLVPAGSADVGDVGNEFDYMQSAPSSLFDGSGHPDMSQLYASHMRLKPMSMNAEAEATNALRRLSIDDKLTLQQRQQLMQQQGQLGQQQAQHQRQRGRSRVRKGGGNRGVNAMNDSDSDNEDGDHKALTGFGAAGSSRGHGGRSASHVITGQQMFELIKTLPEKELRVFHTLYGSYVEEQRQRFFQQQQQQAQRARAQQQPRILALPAPSSPVETGAISASSSSSAAAPMQMQMQMQFPGTTAGPGGGFGLQQPQMSMSQQPQQHQPTFQQPFQQFQPAAQMQPPQQHYSHQMPTMMQQQQPNNVQQQHQFGSAFPNQWQQQPQQQPMQRQQQPFGQQMPFQAGSSGFPSQMQSQSQSQSQSGSQAPPTYAVMRKNGQNLIVVGDSAGQLASSQAQAQSQQQQQQQFGRGQPLAAGAAAAPKKAAGSQPSFANSGNSSSSGGIRVKSEPGVIGGNPFGFDYPAAPLDSSSSSAAPASAFGQQQPMQLQSQQQQQPQPMPIDRATAPSPDFFLTDSSHAFAAPSPQHQQHLQHQQGFGSGGSNFDHLPMNPLGVAPLSSDPQLLQRETSAGQLGLGGAFGEPLSLSRHHSFGGLDGDATMSDRDAFSLDFSAPVDSTGIGNQSYSPLPPLSHQQHSSS